jgi:hypothetical protein
VTDDVSAQFRDAVNMTASELQMWLRPDESGEVRQNSDGGESVGHDSGGPLKM